MFFVQEKQLSLSLLFKKKVHNAVIRCFSCFITSVDKNSVLLFRHDLHSKTASREMPGTECGPLHDLCRPYQSI